MGAEKRSPNCFVLYRRDKALEIRKANPKVSFPNHVLSQMSGAMWKKEPLSIRNYYQELARQVGLATQPGSSAVGPSTNSNIVSVSLVSVVHKKDLHGKDGIHENLNHLKDIVHDDSSCVNDGTVWATVRTPSPSSDSEWFPHH